MHHQFHQREFQVAAGVLGREMDDDDDDDDDDDGSAVLRSFADLLRSLVSLHE